MRWNALHNKQTKDCEGGGREIVCTDRDCRRSRQLSNIDMESSIKKMKEQKNKIIPFFLLHLLTSGLFPV